MKLFKGVAQKTDILWSGCLVWHIAPVAFVICMYATRVTLINSTNRQQSKRQLGATPGWMIDERLEDASSNLWF